MFKEHRDKQVTEHETRDKVPARPSKVLSVETPPSSGKFVRREHVTNSIWDEVKSYLRKLKFRKCLLGGVAEEDVWKKLAEINALYEKALVAERARYDALLAYQKQGVERTRRSMSRRKEAQPGVPFPRPVVQEGDKRGE